MYNNNNNRKQFIWKPDNWQLIFGKILFENRHSANFDFAISHSEKKPETYG